MHGVDEEGLLVSGKPPGSGESKSPRARSGSASPRSSSGDSGGGGGAQSSTDTLQLAKRLRSWRECVGGTMSSHAIALADAALEGYQLRLHHAATASLQLATFLDLIPCVSRVLCAGLTADPSHERALHLLDEPFSTGSFMFHLPLGTAEEAEAFAHTVGVRSAGGGGAIELAFGTKSLPSWLFPEDETRGLVHVKSGYWFVGKLDAHSGAAAALQHRLVTAMAKSSALCVELASATAELLAPRTKSTSGRLRLGEVQPTERWSNEYYKTLLPYGVPQNSGQVYFLSEPSPADASIDASDGQDAESDGDDLLLFAELLGLADPAEGAAEGDLVASVGRGSDLEACGRLGLALAESVERDGQDSCVRVGVWRLLDINTIIWTQGAAAALPEAVPPEPAPKPAPEPAV